MKNWIWALLLSMKQKSSFQKDGNLGHAEFGEVGGSS